MSLTGPHGVPQLLDPRRGVQRGKAPLPRVWECSPMICHCEPFSERSEGKAKQSPLPEIAASPPAPRKDKLGETWGTKGVEGFLVATGLGQNAAGN